MKTEQGKTAPFLGKYPWTRQYVPMGMNEWILCLPGAQESVVETMDDELMNDGMLMVINGEN